MSQPALSSDASPSGVRPFKGVREQLIRRGMPLDYAERSVAELEDHHADLVEELQRYGVAVEEADEQALTRLGEPKKLVSKIVRDYQRRTLIGRWPLISFVLAPLPLLVMAWAAGIFILINPLVMGCEAVWGSLGFGRPSITFQAFSVESVLVFLFTFIPCAVAYAWYRMALRSTSNRWYALPICLPIALAAGSVWFTYTVSDVPMGSRVMVASPVFIFIHNFVTEIPNPELIRFDFGPREALQLLAPLAVGAWLIYRETKRRREALGLSSPLEDQRLAA